MRADAARNLDTVLRTGARLLADDPATSIAAIAAEAGVDRRTVYRRFATREDLLTAVYQRKLVEAERVMDAARLTEAPVAVALHRYVEGIIPVSREWPVDVARMRQDTSVRDHVRTSTARLAAFVTRATDEGLIRADLPPGWAALLLNELVHLAAHQLSDLDPAPAADLVVDTLLRAVGTQPPR